MAAFPSFSLLLSQKELSVLVAFQNKRRTVRRSPSLSVCTCLANQHSACRLSQTNKQKKTLPMPLNANERVKSIVAWVGCLCIVMWEEGALYKTNRLELKSRITVDNTISVYHSVRWRRDAKVRMVLYGHSLCSRLQTGHTEIRPRCDTTTLYTMHIQIQKRLFFPFLQKST